MAISFRTTARKKAGEAFRVGFEAFPEVGTALVHDHELRRSDVISFGSRRYELFRGQKTIAQARRGKTAELDASRPHVLRNRNYRHVFPWRIRFPNPNLR